jgi:prenyltransferase beta subunit
VSVRLETLQVARLAPKLLGESADLVEGFVRAQLNADGGFGNRAGDSDLYYTVFGLQALVALRAELPAADVGPYLRHYGTGETLDFVHLACLARCWALLGPEAPGLEAAARQAIAERIERHRTPEGGYHASPGASHGSAYHAYLALGAYQDLGVELPGATRLAASLDAVRAGDGAYANAPAQPHGSTPATAAAVAVMRHLREPLDPAVGEWLISRCRDGGFCAAAAAPVPDLLSTATALHALASVHRPIDGIREACLDFVDSLWTSRGAFYGTWADDTADCEYTFYGLLALGHLAV